MPFWCFLPPPTLFVTALFTWTVLQSSRCTCPLSIIWHLDISLGGWLCNSSNALLKLAQYSGRKGCRGASQVKPFQTSVWFKRSSWQYFYWLPVSKQTKEHCTTWDSPGCRWMTLSCIKVFSPARSQILGQFLIILPLIEQLFPLSHKKVSLHAVII